MPAHPAPESPPSVTRHIESTGLIAANVTPQPPGVHALREMLAEQLASAHRRPFGILTFTIDDYPVLLGSFGWRVVDTLAQMVSSMLDASTCRMFQFASDSYAVVLLDRGNKNLAELSESVQTILLDVQRAMRRQADVSVSASIGMLVVGPQTQTSVDRLVDHAIAAGFASGAGAAFPSWTVAPTWRRKSRRFAG